MGFDPTVKQHDCTARRFARRAFVGLSTLGFITQPSPSVTATTVPELVRPTQVISVAELHRTDHDGQQDETPAFELPPPSHRLAHPPGNQTTHSHAQRNAEAIQRGVNDSLRGMLDVAPVNRSGDATASPTRTNRYFDLHQSGIGRPVNVQANPFASSPSPVDCEIHERHVGDRPTSNSASNRMMIREGAVQTNPLVRSPPPKLQQFRTEDLRADSTTVDHSPISDSTKSQSTAVQELRIARKPTLAKRNIEDIDQVLDVLNTTTDTNTSSRSLASQSGFGMLAIDEIGSHLSSDHAVGEQLATQAIKLPSPFQPNQAGLKPVEVDDLIRHAKQQSKPTSNQTRSEPKPGFVDQISALGKKLKLVGRSKKSLPTTPPARSGGILSNWLKNRS
ncbi:MAG: hypothetical protein AAF745_16890 [Planctomycetota bacterium]